MNKLFASLSLLISIFAFGDVMAAKNPILEQSRNATVRVFSEQGKSSGTGFLIGERIVLTCFHVIGAYAVQEKNINVNVFPDIKVALASGEVIDGTVISMPTQADLTPLERDFAFVRLKTKPSKAHPALTLAAGNEVVEVGDEIVFSGYPLAVPGMVTHRGMVSGKNQEHAIIFVQASINKGNSGGALLNQQGHVIGIVSMREGGITVGLQQLQQQIDATAAQGSIQLMGVDPLQASKALIQTLDQYISTGIGYARVINSARDYMGRNPASFK